jgi:hypothetical protein
MGITMLVTTMAMIAPPPAPETLELPSEPA